MRILTLAIAIAALSTVGACKKTGEGQYEVQKPVVGTQTDTINTPTVETGTVKDTITVPTVGTEKKEVSVPKVEVKKPRSRFALLEVQRYIAHTRGALSPAGLFLHIPGSL